jgi:predicted enzyme related to lactoylglutathione lyase
MEHYVSIRNAGIALISVLVAACATVNVNLPPITEAPTGERHDGKVVWRDLLTNTPDETRRFYGELFGWEFEKPGINIGVGGAGTYTLIRHKGRLIGGIVDTVALGKSDNISQWVTTMAVTDIETAVDRVVDAGGIVMSPPESIGSRGRMALVEDPTGALFAMLQTSEGDPPDHEPDHNGWLWDELWTNDVGKATDFYREVVGFQHTDHDIDDSDNDYRVLKMNDTPRAGVLPNPFEGERPVWVNYLRVEDPSAITARVESLGGKILVESQERPIGGEVAFIAGPSGAGVALQTWPLN